MRTLSWILLVSTVVLALLPIPFLEYGFCNPGIGGCSTRLVFGSLTPLVFVPAVAVLFLLIISIRKNSHGDPKQADQTPSA